LRMEKAYRAWGSEHTNEVTLIEADMQRFVDWSKDFIGKSGTLESRQRGPRTLLTYLEVDAADADCLGNEPVFCRDRLVGLTSSGAYGFAARKSLAFAYVEPSVARAGEQFEILLRGAQRAARIIEQPAWDPGNERLRT